MRTNGMYLTNNIMYMLMKVSKLMRWLSDLINIFITPVDYLTARKNEVELLTTKFYNLHIVSVFHHKSVCHKIERVQLRFVQIHRLKAIQQNMHTFIFYKV